MRCTEDPTGVAPGLSLEASGPLGVSLAEDPPSDALLRKLRPVVKIERRRHLQNISGARGHALHTRQRRGRVRRRWYMRGRMT